MSKRKRYAPKIDLNVAVVGSLRRLANTANAAAQAIEDAKDEADGQLSFKDMFACVRPHAKDLFSFGIVYSALKRAASGK